jgi:cytochrome c551/c552
MNLFLDKKLRINKITLIGLFTALFLFGGASYAQLDGKALFKQNCASCHHPLNKGTGPALQGAKAKWESAGDDIYAWVKNPNAQYDAGVKSALAIGYNRGGMAGVAVNNEEIDAVLKYVDEFTAPVPVIAASASSTSGVQSNQSSAWIWWLIIGLSFLILIVALWGVRKQLTYANQEKLGEEVKEETIQQELKGWMWRNLKLVTITGFILTCAAVYWGAERLYEVGIYENYIPEQPLAFTHKVHAGDNEIDCQYCHSSASKSKHAGIPSVNVCMNCHKGIVEASSGERGTAEIAKIHKAAGYDVEERKYTGETEPIKWVKAHNLPDHVYFNHSQHVTVGKIECENCHGPVKEYTVGRTSSTEMINNMELKGVDKDKKIIKLERPLLTMGWCIECHSKADVQTEGSKYYDDIHERLKSDKELYKSVMQDGKVTVKEMGGWECAKCHY